MNRQVFADAQRAAVGCSAHILKLLSDRPRAAIAISGGSTPRLLFAEMAKASFQWDNVHIFWVDERGVPPVDPESNFRLADETLLTPARISKYNVHRVHAELPPAEAASRYIDEIREFFGLRAGQLPVFDVIHCGIGPDAHTASLFPGEPLIDDRANIAAAIYSSKFSQWRITLLPGVLLKARQTVVLAAGADKAAALRAVFDGPFDPKRHPAQLCLREETTWFLDQAAVA